MFLTTAKPLIDDGRVVGLGVTSADAWFNLPQLKPLTELGLKGFVVPGWNGMMAPKGTPPAVIAKLSEALSAALEHGRCGTRRSTPWASSPALARPGR